MNIYCSGTSDPPQSQDGRDIRIVARKSDITVGKAIINTPRMHGKIRPSEMSLKIQPNNLSENFDKPFPPLFVMYMLLINKVFTLIVRAERVFSDVK